MLFPLCRGIRCSHVEEFVVSEVHKTAPEFLIDGVVPIIPTPFQPSTTGAGEHPDWDSFQGLIDFAYAGGAYAVCLPAYASEFYKLSEDEREAVVVQAVKFAAGRIPVIAQVNYTAPEFAIRGAKAALRNGASAICMAVPRLIPVGERDLFRYFAQILSTVELPYIIQDYNPGGPNLSPRFVAELHTAFPHFRYIKLEIPMMASLVRGIVDETHGEVGVLEGWGGMYMLELVPAGIAGIMPGLGAVDILSRVFRLARQGNLDQAYDIFIQVLPWIVYSLQNMELYHHVEKRLLNARGILESTTVRSLNMELSRDDERQIAFLNGKVLSALDRLGIPHNPGSRKKGSRQG
jgi:4-hydroxy-tetrahydrodipicolinate synthase